MAASCFDTHTHLRSFQIYLQNKETSNSSCFGTHIVSLIKSISNLRRTTLAIHLPSEQRARQLIAITVLTHTHTHTHTTLKTNSKFEMIDPVPMFDQNKELDSCFDTRTYLRWSSSNLRRLFPYLQHKETIN